MRQDEVLIDSLWPKKCHKCGTQYLEDTFELLELDCWKHSKNGKHPRGVTLEIRICTCGASIEHAEFDTYEDSFEVA